MATSPEKVAAAIEQAAGQLPELQRQAAGMPAIALAAVSSFIPTLTRMAKDNVPADPAALDALLDGCAVYVLSLKSDPPADADATAVEDQGGEPHGLEALEGTACAHGVEPGTSCPVCGAVAA